MTDHKRLDLLRGVLMSQRVAALPTPRCLDDETIAALVDGTLEDPAAKAAAVGHLEECSLCRAAVASVANALADPAVKREISALEGRGRRRRVAWAMVPLAAAAALVVFVWRGSGINDGGSSMMRDSTIAGAKAPTPLTPRDRVAGVTRFVWSSIPGVVRYRVRLYTGDGTVLWTKETADTVLAAPPVPLLTTRIPYFWMVEAEIEWRRWTSSALVEFRVGARDDD